MNNSRLAWSFSFVVLVNFNICLLVSKSFEVLFAFLGFSYGTLHAYVPAAPFLEPITV